MTDLDRREFLRLAGVGTVALATSAELDPAGARLVDVKTRYDPENRLRFRQGIQPRN